VLCSALALAAAPARAGTAYVDGISDQSLPAWDGGFAESYFARLFDSAWVGAGHIKLARYVAQWDLMDEPSGGADPHGDYRERLEAWLADIHTLGLVPDLALTSYDAIHPQSPDEYAVGLSRILAMARAQGEPIAYLEPWNEPNNQGHETAVRAAELTNSAARLCEHGGGCRVVAGNLEDSADVAGYEREYERALDPVPTLWGVHPYHSVEEQSEAPVENFVRNLPNGGAGDRIWFTEVAARRCTNHDGHAVQIGEAGQAERARFLTRTLMPAVRPEHVFYYVFLLADHRVPSCAVEHEDDALYRPAGEPGAPEEPRAAASYIWGDEPGLLAHGCSEPLAFEGPGPGEPHAVAWTPSGGLRNRFSLTVLSAGCRALRQIPGSTFTP
jgi:hypothetical protein